jgi:hypothetical protein
VRAGEGENVWFPVRRIDNCGAGGVAPVSPSLQLGNATMQQQHLIDVVLGGTT